MDQFDWIRKGLMFEPRGHDMMSGAMLFPPHDPENDAGVLFIETSGCLPMCGHGTIGTVTIAVEEGLIIPKKPGFLRLEVPAGLIEVSYELKGKKVTAVTLTNVASFLAEKDIEVFSEELGRLKVDVAYGGNFYAIVDAQENFPGLEHFKAEQLVAMSRAIRKNLNASHSFSHPHHPQISGISHILWTGKPISATATARNAVFYGEKAIDRSPCGTGTSARMAQWYAKGQLEKGQEFIHESFIGSQFIGKIVSEAKVGTYFGIIPSIQGWAMVTGYNTIILDDEDPYVHGFQVI